MEEFYLVIVSEERSYYPSRKYGFSSTRDLIEYLEEFFGHDIAVMRVFSDGSCKDVEEFNNLVEKIDENDLWEELWDDNDITDSIEVFFEEFKAKLPNLEFEKPKGKYYACDSCGEGVVIVKGEPEKCLDPNQDCECNHLCSCEKITEIEFI